MARSCVFCGDSGLTKEHLFARWVRDELQNYRSPAITEFARNDSLEWAYPTKSMGHTVKEFCATCNNEWMSQLEQRAGPIMAPMLQAKQIPVKMGFAAQRTVAAWAMKTAMVMHRLHPADRRIPVSDYREFHRRKEPSSSAFVMIGARHISGGSTSSNVFDYKERYIGRESAGIQHVHFAIGALYFGITMFVGRKRQFPMYMNDDAAWKALLIWPAQPQIIWPSPSISDIGGVEGMFDAFAGAFWD